MNRKVNTPAAVRFNHDSFAYEIFDREVIVLNMIDGTYYAFGGSTPQFWEDLVSGRSIDRIIAALEDRGSTALSDVRSSVSSFVGALMEEQILLFQDVDTGALLRLNQSALIAPFAPPTIEKHVDMQDLLTLDPIHDVEPEKGWPRS